VTALIDSHAKYFQKTKSKGEIFMEKLIVSQMSKKFPEYDSLVVYIKK
jgi:hypothetical protein